MTVNIGIFHREEEVVEAIRLLQEAGVDQHGIHVILKNAENAPLIATDTDVHVEDLAGIQDAREDDSPPASGRVFPWGLAGLPTAGHTGAGTSGTPAGYGGALVLGGFRLLGHDDDTERVLRDVGVPAHASERCEEEVGAGRYLLLTEAGENTDATELLRRAGASDVIH